MADNLTLRLQEELAKRGKVVSSSDIEKILKKNNISSQPSQTAQPTQPQIPQQPNQDMWSQLGSGQFPDWYEQDNKKNTDNSTLNALAVGTWSLLDAAAFGVPGAFVEEEEYLDFEDPLAKWTGAIGSFAGYVRGAPLKVGMGLAKRLTSKVAPKLTGKEGVTTVLKGMRKIGKDGGVSNKSIREASRSYESLVQKAQIDPNLQGQAFASNVKKLSENFVTNGLLKGEITEQQGSAILRMFEGQALKRPLQDFRGLAIAKYGASNPKLARFLGEAINDVTAFAFIDTVMEGVTTIEDHHYDWTQPLWGSINGLAFSSLSILNPKGKASRWTSDFKVGLKAAFSQKSPYSKMNKEELSKPLRFISESLSKNGYKGKNGLDTIEWMGKEIQLKSDQPDELASDFIEKVWTKAFPKNTEKAMRSFLESQRKKFGRDIMKWASKEEAANIMEVWPRMITGGLLFNAHSFYDMYANDQDYDFATDILPNMLIGAYIQRHNNPARFDMDSATMNRLRSNLSTLGFHPDQLTSIPSLKENMNEFKNPIHLEKSKPIVELAKELEVVTDINEVVDTNLPNNVKSVQAETLDGSADPTIAKFTTILKYLETTSVYTKNLDQISVKDAKTIVKKFEEIHPDFDYNKIDEFESNVAGKQLEGFEDIYENIITQLGKDNSELKHTSDSSDDSIKVPQTVLLSDQILKDLKNGNIDWMQDKDPNELTDAIASYNAVTATVTSMQKNIKINPNEKVVTLSDLGQVKSIYDTIIKQEASINNKFKNNIGHVKPFSFARNFEDFNFIVMDNHRKKFSQNVINIFKPELESEQKNELINKLTEVGILQTGEEGDLFGTLSIIKSIDQIQFKDGNPEENAERKRILGTIHSLQYLLGNYKDTVNVQKKIEPEAVDRLVESLSKDFGYKVKDVSVLLNKRILNYAISEKIGDSKLEIGDINAIVDLKQKGFAEMGATITGKGPVGFSISPLDATLVKEQRDDIEDKINKYNTKIQDIADRSGGLVKVSNTKQTPNNVELINDILDSFPLDVTISDNESHANTRTKLLEFIQLLGQSDYPNTNLFRERLGEYVRNGGIDSTLQAVNWLKGFGVIIELPKTGEFDLDMKAYNDEVKKKIEDKLNIYGFTPKYVERHYETMSQISRDNKSRNDDVSEYLRNISIQDFFKKYRFDGGDYSQSSMEEMNKVLDNSLFNNVLDAKDKGEVISESLKKFLNRLSVPKVHNKNEYTPYKTLTNKRKKQVSSDVVKDVIQLFGSRRHQKHNDVISFKYGTLHKTKQIQQYTRMDKFFEDLGVKYYSIDPYTVDYLRSDDGTRIEKKQINMFGDSSNLPKYLRDKIKERRSAFDGLIKNIEQFQDGESVKGPNGEKGLMPIVIGPNSNLMLIKISDLAKINSKFDEFVKKFGKEDSGLDYNVRTKLTDLNNTIKEKSEKGELAVNNDYRAIIRRLFAYDYLAGSDGDSKFIKYLNNDQSINISKLMGRVKLYNTKNFIRYTNDFIDTVSDIYNSIGEKDTSKILKDRMKKNGFSVSIWDDSSQAKIKDSVNEFAKIKGIDWDFTKEMGNAHLDVSSYDSISYVNKDTMKFLHTMLGHDPDSPNAIKPIITSGGKDSPLLLGKTLFIYSKELDPFFNKNNVDILLTSSGAKAFNESINKEGVDESLINVKDTELNKVEVRTNQIRKISINSLGLKPEKETLISTAKESQADTNYMSPEEQLIHYADNIDAPLTAEIRKAERQLEKTGTLRQFVIDQFGDDALINSIDGTNSMNHLSGIAFFASATNSADPMSYSPSIVKNKLYSVYFDKILNNKRSVTNQFEVGESDSYGGQAFLIQAPINSFIKNKNGILENNPLRLKPTLAKKDNDGKFNILSRGEVLLTDQDRKRPLRELLLNNKFNMKLVEDNEVYNIKEKYDEIRGEGKFNKLIDSGITLGDLYEKIKLIGSEDLQIGVIVRRNPRTRPNDMAIMGLKGFLDKSYGNSMMINSFDVVNVFEGDYDADKADYFFAQKENMYEHLIKSSSHFVQGIDPSKYIEPSKFNWDLPSDLENQFIEEMHANDELFTKSIGLVQKVPRMLNYLNGIGSKITEKDSEMSNFKESNPNAKVLFKGQDEDGKYKIILDYDNTDFYQRSALETQLIIDGTGKLNKEIAQDIYSWRDEFLFGEGQDRISVFKRVRLVDGKYEEQPVLASLDKALIKQMLSEYGKLLGVSGDSAYENSGESKSVSYEDRMSAISRFSMFNGDMTNKLYYALRNRYVDDTRGANGEVKNKAQWKDNKDFKKLFDVSDEKYKVKKKTIKYQKPNRTGLFENESKQFQQQYATGQRGASLERSLYQINNANLFENNSTDALVGDARKLTNDWYDELTSDPNANVDEISWRLKGLEPEKVKKAVIDINKSINIIRGLKKTISKVKFNEKIKFQTKQKSINTLNESIKFQENLVRKWLTKEYEKSFSSKDLKNINFVDVDSKSLKQGTIFYSTIDSIEKLLPFDTVQFGLDKQGIEDLNRIKKFRRLFYGNQDSLQDVMKFGNKTLLSTEQLKFLENKVNENPLNSHYELENELLYRGVSKYGMRFLWAFMKPAVNKYNIGLHNNRPVAVPFEATESYDPTSRYRRGVNFLTEFAKGSEKFKEFDKDYSINSHERLLAESSLKYLQMTENKFKNFFNNSFDIDRMVSDNIGDSFNFGFKETVQASYDSIRLPDFHSHLQKNLNDFGTISWNKTGDRIKNGFPLINDHLMEFYSDILKTAGKGEAWESYQTSMNDFQKVLLSNKLINPLDYLSMRLKLDKEVAGIAKEVFTSGLAEGNGKPELVKKLMNNPVYSLMGGGKYMNGLTLENKQVTNIDYMKNIMENSKRIENVKNNMPTSPETQGRLEKMEYDMEMMNKCSV